MKKNLLLSIVLMSCSMISSATHNAGGFIRYEYVADSVFDFYFTYYRDCTGVPLSNPSNQTSISCKDGSNRSSLPLTLLSIKDITTICPGDSSPCSPPNTRGTKLGFEEHVYKVRIDFTSAPFKNIFACGEAIIETSQCCRPGEITTGSANTLFYLNLYINFNLARKSASPKHTFNPDQTICCNKPAYLDFSASDKDGDSISYSLINPKTSKSASASYTGKLSAQVPFDVYYSDTTRKINPNSKPPEGFHFDSLRGYATFTPVKCNEISIIVVETKEWRKDSSGVYQLVSTSQKELLIMVENCPGNNPPEVLADSMYQICDGKELCFSINSSDSVYIPPPPLPTPDPDSVSLRWNREIPGATFTILNPGDRLQKARLCWSPKIGNQQVQTYKLVVTAEDDNCPSVGRTSKTIEIQVLPKPTLDLGPDDAREKPFSYKLDAGNLPGKYLWNNGDTNSSITVSDWGTYWVELQHECDTVRDSINITPTVGIRDINPANIKIFPNPSKGVVKIQSNAEIIAPIEIRDLLGREIEISQIRDEQTSVLHFDSHAEGLYHVMIHTINGTFSSQLVIIR